MILKITDIAKEKFQEQIKKRGHGVGVRIATRPSGCNGLSYYMEYVDNPPKPGTEDFSVFYAGDTNIYILGEDYPYLDGMEVDYVKKGLNEGFEFHNPNSRGDCGCGESFRV
jgi:iron-sulfur cluster assembly protein